MFWELARVGPTLLIGDQGGRTHLIRVISGDFTSSAFRQPVEIPDLRAVRAAVSDLEVPVLREVTVVACGLRVRCVFADRTWFVRR